MLAAIAMTEPGCGSDLKAISTRARRDGDHYVIDGAKTFITNGFTGNLLIVAARTSGAGSKGVSLFVLETENLPGFRVGRLLERSACRPRTRRSFSSTACAFQPTNCWGR